jgi:hypothetical protein
MDSDKLEKIEATLDGIFSILLLLNKDKLDNVKKKLLKSGTVKETIYNMCDETKTTEEMAKVLGKDSPYVRSYLSILRREGLIRNVVRDGKQVYQQMF